MTVPKHPVNERKACLFHTAFAVIGIAHVVGGVLMTWFHGVGALRHWKSRNETY